jgi:hypothetical protein
MMIAEEKEVKAFETFSAALSVGSEFSPLPVAMLESLNSPESYCQCYKLLIFIPAHARDQ